MEWARGRSCSGSIKRISQAGVRYLFEGRYCVALHCQVTKGLIT